MAETEIYMGEKSIKKLILEWKRKFGIVLK
jgi:hypothetical protein